jgi:hypothetical protein
LTLFKLFLEFESEFSNVSVFIGELSSSKTSFLIWKFSNASVLMGKLVSSSNNSCLISVFRVGSIIVNLFSDFLSEYGSKASSSSSSLMSSVLTKSGKALSVLAKSSSLES